jgi:catechol 2,3-dioxygenase-like lactoylglutathione lyase family enzyme
MNILDHITLGVPEVAACRPFYEQALAPLGIAVVKEFGTATAFGVEGNPSFWLFEGEEPQRPMHIAFVAPSRAHVRAFYEAALAAGGSDNGAPGVREIYHPDYYGAFVLDPNGHNIEAVCRLPESEA